MRNDSFDPVRPVPRFLAEQEEQGFGDVRHLNRSLPPIKRRQPFNLPPMRRP
jgi:hypothetical protein